jgi:hypothetical protein
MDARVLETAFVGLTSLTSLKLSYNDFTVFPTGILECKALKYLRMDRAGKYKLLSAFPSTISKLTNLETLIMTNMHITGVRHLPIFSRDSIG